MDQHPMTTHACLDKLKEVIALAVNHHAEMCTFWYDVYSYYRLSTTPQQRNWYAYDTQDFEIPDLQEAFEIYRNKQIADNRTHKAPLPSDLKAILRPAVDLDGEANAIAARMFADIGRFGRNNTSGARAHIGEAGWWAVEQLGGWQTLCQDTHTEDRKTLTAQWRDLVRGRLQVDGTQEVKQLKLDARKRAVGGLSNIGEIVESIKPG